MKILVNEKLGLSDDEIQRTPRVSVLKLRRMEMNENDRLPREMTDPVWFNSSYETNKLYPFADIFQRQSLKERFLKTLNSARANIYKPSITDSNQILLYGSQNPIEALHQPQQNIVTYTVPSSLLASK